ncbi:Metallophosphoesterase [Nitrosococcus oceani ATCC 19707]|uniref:Metallophosphoesterase n=2 Tax=Nitrosococcus oceani TaxID=1229 RepID=Q3JEM1_NITOC|nr:phosphodiesterase [Nitrosococcus oceani]ABA56725.1 Metallophosphoesterase [Nitrosococcus oceani ATCC 19707]EDZ66574.1 Ser/Thr protein phosphatase family protein [Nitrosococcus oceani AFC27]KFI20861.1 metallophosphoesterase [Nitrosococcus oceani C-27]GEM21613.1 phosphodiesterase [Nitrosococcus oceani]
MTSLPHLKIANDRSEFINVLQLTDSHLLADSEAFLWNDLNTRRSLVAVLNHIQQQGLLGDLMVISGDIAEKAEPEAYYWLLERCQELGLPVYCLPGNHDDPVLMDEILNGMNVSTESLVTLKNWQLIFLNSVVTQRSHGHLSKGQLGFLNRSLADSLDLNTLIFLHHPPVALGSPWMDAMGVDNAADFFAVLDLYPQVRGVAWGHAHQEFHTERQGVQLLGSPSTCVQFVPGSEHFQLDQRGPGYRWLILLPGGQIETRVYYVDCPPPAR